MSTYFPDKPADVTCETCPYLLRERARPHVSSTGLFCARKSADVTNQQMGAMLDETRNWCGEHPWFVRERARQDVWARHYAEDEFEIPIHKVEVITR